MMSSNEKSSEPPVSVNGRLRRVLDKYIQPAHFLYRPACFEKTGVDCPHKQKSHTHMIKDSLLSYLYLVVQCFK